MMWKEEMTCPLTRECSTTELHGRILGSHPVRGAGEGNRTLVISLEGFCSTIELHPPSNRSSAVHFTRVLPPFARSTVQRPESWWRGLDSNQRRRKANRFTVC